MATPSIYRLPNPNNPNVQDIYDAATNKKIPDPVTLARDYK